jgi:hypothetical protein
LALIRRAIRERWNVRPAVRRLIVAAIMAEIERDPAARWSISAVRTLVAADSANAESRLRFCVRLAAAPTSAF